MPVRSSVLVHMGSGMLPGYAGLIRRLGMGDIYPGRGGAGAHVHGELKSAAPAADWSRRTRQGGGATERYSTRRFRRRLKNTSNPFRSGRVCTTPPRKARRSARILASSGFLSE